MTATITKRADELKIGDIFITDKGRRLIVHADLNAQGGCSVTYVELDSATVKLKYSGVFGDTKVETALSPAQQHAEELLDLARRVSAAGINPPPGSLADIAAGLLAKIDPPKPPTLAEALDLLGVARDVLASKNAEIPAVNELLDRAQRCGEMK